tara:strand:- start:142 stop:840 length:699 start_codon:yes stop_codon:yes gene_type:complete
MLPGLLIFDFDGVIADSEIISLSTLQSALRAYGNDLELDEVRRRYLGKSMKQIKRDMQAEHADTNWDGFDAHWNAILFDRFRNELRPLPGLVALLDRVETCGLPYCIASSGGLERIDVALDAMGLSARFSHVFSAEQVRHGKPAPDLFLLAAQTIRVPPDQCLVLEDSPFGIRAAKSAGMRALGFVGGSHLEGIRAEHRDLLLEHGAHDVVEHLNEITIEKMSLHLTMPDAD